MSLKDQIKAIDSKLAALVEHPVPAWGVVVYLRRMTVADRLALGEKFNNADPEGRVALLVIYGACDSDGVMLFSGDEIETVKGLDADSVISIAGEVRRLNKLQQTTEEIDAAKKALPTIPADVSPSA